MKKTLLSLLAIPAFVLGSFSQNVHKDAQDGKIWLKLNDGVVTNFSNNNSNQLEKFKQSFSFIENFIEEYGISEITQPFSQFKAPKVKDVFQIEFNDIQKVDEMVRLLNQVGLVEYAEMVPLDRKTLTPNDPSYSPGQQWNLFQINAGSAWDVSTGSNNIVVAVVDDAVDITHPDLSPIMWNNSGEIAGNGTDDDNNGYVDDVNGADVANGTGDPNPIAPFGSFDHGTHVAGISAAASNNGTGVASIGFNLRLMGVRCASNNGSLTSTLQGVLYAIDNGANVINMSYGSAFFSQTYQNAINYGNGQNVVMVAAAGNDNVDDIFYPAGYDNVISVAATNGTDAKAGFSNYDDGSNWIDLSAPGTSIYSTLPSQGNSSYGTKQGTSMASPLVAGLSGLMLSLNPGLTPADVENCLTSTCDPTTGSFSALLGAGRINALEAMNCVAATLNLPPVAQFTADINNIVVGNSVNYTDLSSSNPTSWSWTFQGGTPGTSTQQNPQNITYNTPGTYNVSLTVTNANGNDTETKNGYIIVNDITGCDTITNTLDADNISTWSWQAPESGYIAGHSTLGATRFAERYTGYGPTNVTGGYFYFTEGNTVDPNSVVTITVWEDNAGEPGTIVYTQDVPLSEIDDNANTAPAGQFYITNVNFDSPAVVNTNDFYVGYQITYSGTDTVTCGMTQNLAGVAGRTNTAFMYFPNGNAGGYPQGWYDVPTLTGGGAEMNMHIYPRITDAPPQVSITPNPASACTGDQVTFDASGSANGVNFNWAINGTTTPYPTGSSPSVYMSAAGNHWVYVQVFNYCGFSKIDSIQYTVTQTPIVSVTPQDEYICPGDNVNLTASGANTYSWSPGGSLSGTTGANVTASPTSTTTYSIQGSDNGCTAVTEVTVIVEETPTSVIDYTPSTNLCFNQPIYFDGGINSEGVTDYQWSFDSGSPASSSNSTEYVTFPGSGTYTVTLTGANGCGDDDVATVDVTIGDCDFNSIDENENQLINGFINPLNDELNITFKNMPSGTYELEIYSLTGQMIQSKSLNVNGSIVEYKLSTVDMAEGMYITHIRNGENQHTFKFKK